MNFELQNSQLLQLQLRIFSRILPFIPWKHLFASKGLHDRWTQTWHSCWFWEDWHRMARDLHDAPLVCNGMISWHCWRMKDRFQYSHVNFLHRFQLPLAFVEELRRLFGTELIPIKESCSWLLPLCRNLVGLWIILWSQVLSSLFSVFE